MKAAVIGLGVGERHFEAYSRHASVDEVILCDFSEKKRQEIKAKYPSCTIVDQAEKVLLDPEVRVVSICSKDDDHFSQICMALENDKHVFVEKPICLYEREAREIRLLLQKKKDLRFSSNLILRKNPLFAELRKELQAGTYGPIFYLEGDYNWGRVEKVLSGWRAEMDFYSAVYGGGIHMIDLMLWLLRDQVAEVSAYGNKIATSGTAFRFNDFAVSILKFKNGVLGKMSVNAACIYPHFHRLSVYGTKRTFENTLEGAYVLEGRGTDSRRTRLENLYQGAHKGDLLLDFLDDIQSNGSKSIPADEIFSTMSVCFAIERSMTTGKPVAVEYL